MKNTRKAISVFMVVTMFLALMPTAMADGLSWVCKYDGYTSPGKYCAFCGRSQEEATGTGSASSSYTQTSQWPQVDFSPVSVQLKKTSDKEGRRQSKGGPNKDYIGVGAYKPYKMRSATAWFTEGDYVLTEIDYSTVGHRCVYFSKGNFDSTRGVERISLSSVSGKMNTTVTPYYGPGYSYDIFAPDNKEMQIGSGTRIQVLMEKDGWLFVEWNCSLGAVRLWVPENTVSAN